MSTAGELIQARVDEIARMKREVFLVECHAHGQTADWHMFSVVELAEVAGSLSAGDQTSLCLEAVLLHLRRNRAAARTPVPARVFHA